MYKLVRGEFFKFFKGAVFKIMIAVLIIAIILSVSLYRPEGDIMTVINEFFGGGIETDVFTMLDGMDSRLMSLASEFGVDIPAEYITMFNEFFTDDFKVSLLSQSPENYYLALNPATRLPSSVFAGLSEDFVTFAHTNLKFYRLLVDEEYENIDAVLSDILALYARNAAVLPIIEAAAALYDALSADALGLFAGLAENYANLAAPHPELDDYTADLFAADFLRAALTASEGYNAQNPPSTPDSLGIILSGYSATRLSQFYTVDEAVTSLVTREDITTAASLAEAVSASGIADKILAADSTDFRLVAEAVIYEVIANGRAADVDSVVFSHISAEYPQLYAYLLSTPLFNEEKLAGLVRAGSDLYIEIINNRLKIVYIFARVVAEAGDISVLTDLFVYELTVRAVHSTLYSTYYDTMYKHADRLLSVMRICKFWQANSYGTVRDLARSLAFEIGEQFASLFAASNRDMSLASDEELGEFLDNCMGQWYYIYRLYGQLNYLIEESGSGDNLPYLYFFQEKGRTPTAYRSFRDEYNYFNSEFFAFLRIKDGAYKNPYKLTSLKNRLNAIVYKRGENGVFKDFRQGEMPMEQKLSSLLAIIDGGMYADMSAEIFAAHYAPLQAEITAIAAYLFPLGLLEPPPKITGESLSLSLSLSQFYAICGFTFDEAAERPPVGYSEFRKLSREFTRKAGLIFDCFQKTYLNEVVQRYNLSDKQLNDLQGIFGMMGYGISKYSIKSDILKDKFLLANPDQIGALSAPMALDAGYGFMTFALGISALFILIFAVFVASGSIAGEHETGTVKLLLIRPYRRGAILAAKMTMLITTLAATFAVMFGVFLAIGAIGWGLDARKVLVVFNATAIHIRSPLYVIASQYSYMLIEFIIYAVIGIMISTVFKSRSASVAVTVFIYFAGTILSLLLSSYGWYKYVLFNNTNLFMYMSNGPSIFDMTFAFSSVVIAVYLTLLVGATFYVFNRRDAS